MTDAWRSSAAYPDPRTTTLKQWAWEFLRRNSDYRADWDDYIGRCGRIRATYGAEAIGDREPTEFASTVHDDPIATVYDPPKQSDESESAWLERVRKGSRVSFGSWLCQKWGLLGAPPQDPAIQHFQWFWSSSKGWVRDAYEVRPQHCRWSERTLRYLAFDLTLPLEPQFSDVKRYLLEQQSLLVAPAW